MQDFSSSKLDQVEENQLGPPDVREEISALKETLSQTRTEVSRLRRRIDRQQLDADAHIRHARVLWVIAFLVVAGFGAAIGYAFGDRDALVARLSGIHTLMDGAGDRKEKEISSSPVFDNSKNQNAELDSAPEVESATADLNSAGIQTQPGMAGDRLQSGGANAPRKEVPMAKPIAEVPIGQVTGTRIEFELLRNKTDEVAPGIFLTVRETNVDRQQLNGWLQIAEDGRTVLLRDQAAQRAMTFSTKRDERNRQLVFTRIDKEGVAGYLLVPLTNEQSLPTSSASSTLP